MVSMIDTLMPTAQQGLIVWSARATLYCKIFQQETTYQGFCCIKIAQKSAHCSFPLTLGPLTGQLGMLTSRANLHNLSVYKRKRLHQALVGQSSLKESHHIYLTSSQVLGCECLSKQQNCLRYLHKVTAYLHPNSTTQQWLLNPKKIHFVSQPLRLLHVLHDPCLCEP